MAISRRAALLTKTYKVLKKHYKPVIPPSDRALLEQLLYACCLENAAYEKADEAFARLQHLFFDWNEVRVSTVKELAEVMTGLPKPREAASNVKYALQNVFESLYSFDLEFLRKKNIGKTVKQLEQCGRITPFVIGYVTQNALKGHAIPVDQGVLDTLLILGVISDAEAKKGIVPGLERAIPKSKGVEFGSLVHQLGASYVAARHSQAVRSILLEIEPDAKERLPKRVSKKVAAKRAADEKRPKARPTKTKAPKAKKKTAKAAKKRITADKQPVGSAVRKKAGATYKKSATKRLSKRKPR